ncbi:autotransporter assembly complex protein TamA [Alloalcanivorax gelatiniphagus]|uniref:Translocation and assembly module subunit TamA n=1 Tax=Alloalcanivorax gelatiniphagus TaxID=1194167 RepID=A0ABY2XS92_9GAMM|nr:autotransporter assembly complex family protein [Alloalcanivorax gelatiniphagus]TMW14779.1 outer membrane protein assembly factor [Alloalcanivorax gelatiniphagus]
MSSNSLLILMALGALLSLALTSPSRADEQPELTVEGELPEGVAANVRTMVDVSRYPCRPGPGQQTLIRRQVRDDALRGLQALGFYQPTLTPRWRNADDDRCFRLTLNIVPGPPTLLATPDIRITGEAADDPAFQKAVDNSALRQGQRLRHDRYESLKRTLQQLLINRGYAEGALTEHRLEVDRDQHRALVVLHVDSGPRYRFGQVELAGDTQLKESLVRAYLGFAAGEPFSNERLLAAQQTYLGTGYFSAVRVERGEPDRADKTIDITLHFNPRNKWALLAGVGVSTDTGPRVRLGIENRRVNAAGHKARAETELSGVRQGVGAGYTIPLSDPLNEKLELRTSYVNETTDTTDSEQVSVGADYIVKLKSGWVATPSVEYLRETYQVADQVDQAELVIPGFQLSRVKSDDPIYPRFGWRLGGKVRGAHKALSSSATFTQYDLWGKLVLPVFKGRFITRGEFGFTDVSDVTELPASLRFFAGGDSSVRGFAYESLGPKNDDGEVIGGRHLLVGSVEYDYPVTQNWSVAVFGDAGNAFNDFDDYEIERSAGFGVRWRSPLGPIRVDLARGVEENRDWRLHLSMGPDL